MAKTFLLWYVFAMMSVAEYAQHAGVSPRSVRARLERGSLRGQKIAGRWMVSDNPHEHYSAHGRKISMASFNQLAAYLDGNSASLTPDARRRAKERAHNISERGVEALRQYAVRADAKPQFYAVPAADLYDLMDERALVLTGVSHEYSEIYGATVDAYVTPRDLTTLKFIYALREVHAQDANVILRVIKEIPKIHPLHVAVDLLISKDPRSEREAERLVKGLISRA